MTECHLSVMSPQTTTATNQASVMHAVIHAWYMTGLISRSVYITIVDSGLRGPRYIGSLLYFKLHTQEFVLEIQSGKVTRKQPQQRLSLLHVTHLLIITNASTKYYQTMSKGIKVMERTRFWLQGR